MKLQFDANQPYQLDAIAAVVDLFDGQPQGAPLFSVIRMGEFGELYAGQERTENGIGNRLLLDADKLRANTRTVQMRNDVDVPDAAAPLASWKLFDVPANVQRTCPHFSVEMETGTGKTYVYLRTILELSRRYGFQKFVIVVPSVAIREGVLKNLEITAEHFQALYDNLKPEFFVYDAKRINRLRHFATSHTLQICVINIQAFNKKEKAVIYKDSDKLSGRQPIEFVQAARPIVVIDEPQSVEGGESGAGMAAIQELNPLCTLRYSATHRDAHNLVYRLDPVRAFELKLVKQIVVASALVDGAANDAFVRVEHIEYKNGIKAKLRIHVQTATGPKEKSVTVKQGVDLFALSDEREIYRHGYEVTEINAEPDNELIRFSGGRSLRLGEEMGGVREDVWRTQIKHTIKRHLENELRVRNRGLKVLSLFFIDRVANYRDHGADGKPVAGKFATAFEAELAALAKDERYNSIEWLRLPFDQLHNGYFAQDKKGVAKDTRGDSQADDEVYNLIMKDKERLLSLHNPLRFIFSHSALREGWDNPNVFQICTLNETRSALKKRQEIGRGLRLPVDQEGRRVFDVSINRLYVMANESYEDFARSLQREYEEECGVTFGRVPLTAFAKLTLVLDNRECPIGREGATALNAALVDQGLLDKAGHIQPLFDPRRAGFELRLPERYQPLAPTVVDLLAGYQLERHIRRDRDEGRNRLKKEVIVGAEFQALWDRIKARTTYRVEFKTEDLVRRAVDSIKVMPPIPATQILVSAGMLEIAKGGIETSLVSAVRERVDSQLLPLPDLLAYLQNETELTRTTLVRILRESERLGDFFVNPQRFMDAVAERLKHTLHRLLVDGIKYERIPGTDPEAEWEMVLFQDGELINYLTSLHVEKSVQEYVVYDSEIEREFARGLDARQDIKLFVKLPRGFLIETPLGQYNPDWAIVKEESETLYLVRETKGTCNFLKLRTEESDKVRCGEKHFQAIGVPFGIAVTATDI